MTFLVLSLYHSQSFYIPELIVLSLYHFQSHFIFQTLIIQNCDYNMNCYYLFQLWDQQRHRGASAGLPPQLRRQPPTSPRCCPGLLLVDIPWGRPRCYLLHRWRERIPALCEYPRYIPMYLYIWLLAVLLYDHPYKI